MTVTLTTTERDLLLRLVDREEAASMMDLLRTLIQRGLVDEGIPCPPPLFERDTRRKRET